MTALVTLVAAAVALSSIRGEAHKPITSPYTFDKDVLPIVRAKCSQCHVAGGVAPMSLATATDATPWAESIRTELVAGHMPPWPVDAPPGLLRNDDRLTGRELNTILTWATGGTPPGDSAPVPDTRRAAEWALGAPDLELPLATATLPANTAEQVISFVVAPKTTSRRMIRAVDLLPGTPSVVRSARIAVRSDDAAAVPAGTLAIERQLALWQPGEPPVALDRNVGFELPAGAQIEVQVRYKKTWMYEGKAMQDRSRIGIYFADDDAQPVRAVTLRGDASSPVPALRILAAYPDPAMTHVRATVSILRRGAGTTRALLAIRADPAWARRYWFTDPIPLPPGDTWAVRFDPFTEIGAAPAALSPSRGITLDVVTAN